MRKHLRQLLITSFIFLYPQIIPVAMAARGLEPVLIKDMKGEKVGLYKESHALVIGVSKYTNGWPPLRGVMKDVKTVSKALEENGFHFR